MRPRRTHDSTHVFMLQEGNEDNDLWGHYEPDEQGRPLLCTVWAPTDKERERIANGENVKLLVWTVRPFPMAMELTDVPIGKKPE